MQLIHAVLSNPEDHTHLRLIFGNVTAEDILFKEHLDELAATHEQFEVYYVLNEVRGLSG